MLCFCLASLVVIEAVYALTLRQTWVSSPRRYPDEEVAEVFGQKLPREYSILLVALIETELKETLLP